MSCDVMVYIDHARRTRLRDEQAAVVAERAEQRRGAREDGDVEAGRDEHDEAAEHLNTPVAVPSEWVSRPSLLLRHTAISLSSPAEHHLDRRAGATPRHHRRRAVVARGSISPGAQHAISIAHSPQSASGDSGVARRASLRMYEYIDDVAQISASLNHSGVTTGRPDENRHRAPTRCARATAARPCWLRHTHSVCATSSLHVYPSPRRAHRVAAQHAQHVDEEQPLDDADRHPKEEELTAKHATTVTS